MAQRKGAAKVRRAKDAVALLMDDHKKVKKLFNDFKKLQDGERGVKINWRSPSRYARSSPFIPRWRKKSFIRRCGARLKTMT